MKDRNGFRTAIAALIGLSLGLGIAAAFTALSGEYEWVRRE